MLKIASIVVLAALATGCAGGDLPPGVDGAVAHDCRRHARKTDPLFVAGGGAVLGTVAGALLGGVAVGTTDGDSGEGVKGGAAIGALAGATAGFLIGEVAYARRYRLCLEAYSRLQPVAPGGEATAPGPDARPLPDGRGG